MGAAGRRPPLAPGAVHRRGVPPGGRLPAPSGPRPVHGRLRHEPDRARPPARPAAGAGPATRGPRPLRAPARPAVPARRRVPPVGVPLGDRVAVAVTDLGPVGIDVERHAPRAAEPAGTVLSPAEAAGYARLPEAERATALIEYWARKEAVRKAPLSPLGRVRRCGTGAGARLRFIKPHPPVAERDGRAVQQDVAGRVGLPADVRRQRRTCPVAATRGVVLQHQRRHCAPGGPPPAGRPPPRSRPSTASRKWRPRMRARS